MSDNQFWICGRCGLSHGLRLPTCPCSRITQLTFPANSLVAGDSIHVTAGGYVPPVDGREVTIREMNTAEDDIRDKHPYTHWIVCGTCGRATTCSSFAALRARAEKAETERGAARGEAHALAVLLDQAREDLADLRARVEKLEMALVVFACTYEEGCVHERDYPADDGIVLNCCRARLALAEKGKP